MAVPKQSHAYLFANRHANRLKVLVHDGLGIWLAARSLCAIPHGSRIDSAVLSPVRSPNAWSNAMTASEFAAESLVRTYLNGRTMEPILFRAVVWRAEKRLTSGMMPVLDATMRTDIDNQAGAPQRRSHSSQAASETPIVCALLHRAYVLSPPMLDPIGTPQRAPHRTVGRSPERHTRG
jgi:hypothetical protein